jgi:hypothetical protein
MSLINAFHSVSSIQPLLFMNDCGCSLENGCTQLFEAAGGNSLASDWANLWSRPSALRYQMVFLFRR